MASAMENHHSATVCRTMRVFGVARSAVRHGLRILGGYLNIDRSGDGDLGTERRHTKRDPVREAMAVQRHWTPGADSQTPEDRR